ncbi:hypothetical protein C0W59_20655, partial [Photobacterium kishitanii]|uniref:hypothetical protein n=1 Tax=Photobacterium kishitanii TaxID=318456 RepID=UPI000D4572B3
MDKKYLLLIVNYKKNILDTETINSILNLEYNDFDVVVWDNLALCDNEKKIKKHNDKINFIYLPSSENIPLSVIYNEVIVNILEKGNYQYFVILDNDTCVDDEYFISHSRAEKKEVNVNLFLPQVINNEQLVSPGYMYGFKGGYLKHYAIGLNDAKNKTAINSGMIIRAKYIKEYNIR